MITNIAIPSTVQVGAQTREQVLVSAEGVAASDVAGQRAQIDAMRSATADVSAQQRLLARVTHLRALVVWGEQWQQRLRAAAAENRPWATTEQATAFSSALAVAHKVLNDREPKAQDQLLSLVDTDARAGKHGDYYDGYLLDVSREADSKLIGALDVLPANGDEGANATPLITSEEQAHGNDIASLSIDRISYRGDLLATLSDDAKGPQLTVYVPPLDWLPPAPELFQPAAFLLNDARDEVRCPGGATTRTRKRSERGHGWRLAFSIPQCRACPVRAQCVKPDAQRGRTGLKSDYEAQYQKARQRTQTAAYHAVRREHPGIERKVAELVHWHAGRRVRYRGRLKVKMQYVLTALVVNGKRMVKLLALPRQPQLASQITGHRRAVRRMACTAECWPSEPSPLALRGRLPPEIRCAVGVPSTQ